MRNKCWIILLLIFIIPVFLFSVSCVNKNIGNDQKELENHLEPTRKTSTPIISDVTLGWDDVPGATSYNMYWSDKPGVNKKNGIKISNVKNPYKMTGLQKGKKYYFVVTAVDASGESEESEEISCIFGQ